MNFSPHHRYGYFLNHNLHNSTGRYLAILLGFIALGSIVFVNHVATVTNNNLAPSTLNSQYYAKNKAEKLLALLPTSFIKQLKQSNPSYRIASKPSGGLTANNVALGLQVLFKNNGIYFQHQETSTYFSMSLESYGFVGHLQPIDPVNPFYRDNKVYYPHDNNLVEWYANTATGIEQLFTVMQAPPRSSENNSLLKLHLSIRGNISSTLENSILWIRHHENAISFNYKNLQVFDKNGQLLPAILSIEDNQLSIEIDTSNATFPITVDPLLSKEYKIPSGDSIVNDYYGTTVAIDGNTAVVGAHAADIAGNKDEGAVYIFNQQTDGSWLVKQKLLTPPTLSYTGSDWFGKAVAISGNTLMVVSIGKGATNQSKKDIVSIFKKDVFGFWKYTSAITDLPNSAGEAGDLLALEGNIAVVGNPIGIGTAFVYQNSTRIATLSTTDGTFSDAFGLAIALRGNTIVVGAKWAELSDGVGGQLTDAGAVYVFEKTQGSQWASTTETQKLIPSDIRAGDLYGYSVDFDGTTVAVGAILKPSPNAGGSRGAAYLFTGGGANWVEQKKFVVGPQETTSYQFGNAISINGNDVVIGTLGADTLSGLIAAGAVSHYKKIGLDWIFQQQIFASDAKPTGFFGYALATSGYRFLIGSPNYDLNIGTAYVLDATIDLAIVKTDSTISGITQPGLTYNYQYSVTNQDPLLTANSVVVSDTLPSGMNLLAINDCLLKNVAGISISCQIGNVGPGQTIFTSVAVDVPAAGVATNTATVKALQFDPDLLNNSHTETTIINTPPIADSLRVDMLQAPFVDIVLTGSDPDQDPISYSIQAGPTDGSYTGNPPNIRYTPNIPSTGDDAFSFIVSDTNQSSLLATVSITGRPTNGAPTPVNDSYNVDEAAQLIITAPGILQNDSDPNKDLLTLQTTPIVAPTNGSLTINLDGSFTYIHDGGESNSDNFSYSVTDPDGATGTAIVDLTVNPINDPPVALNGLLLTQQEFATTSQFIASDVDGGELNYNVVDLPLKGVVTQQLNGNFQYQPNPGEFGKDQFLYRVFDGKDYSNIATFRVYVNQLGNAAPSNPQIISPLLNETDVDSTASVTFVWEKAVDANGDNLQYQIVYCNSVLINSCDPLDVNPQLTLYFNIGGSTVSLLLIGLIGSSRRRQLHQLLYVIGIILLLNACNDAAQESGQPIQISESQMSYTATDLNPATQYYWRILVNDGRGGLSVSDTSQFTTL